MEKEELKSPQRRTLTKRLIREAMLALLKTKPIQDITIRELCDMAGVNRTTFYNHYAGVYEVLGEMEENFLLQLTDENSFSHRQPDLPQHIERLCENLQKNKEIALLLLANNVDPNFSAKLMKLQACGSVWNETVSSYSSDEYELLAQFISGGAYAMVCHWLENGCQQTPKQIATLLTKVLQNGILSKTTASGRLSGTV